MSGVRGAVSGSPVACGKGPARDGVATRLLSVHPTFLRGGASVKSCAHCRVPLEDPEPRQPDPNTNFIYGITPPLPILNGLQALTWGPPSRCPHTRPRCCRRQRLPRPGLVCLLCSIEKPLFWLGMCCRFCWAEKRTFLSWSIRDHVFFKNKLTRPSAPETGWGRAPHRDPGGGLSRLPPKQCFLGSGAGLPGRGLAFCAFGLGGLFVPRDGSGWWTSWRRRLGPGGVDEPLTPRGAGGGAWDVPVRAACSHGPLSSPLPALLRTA